MSSIVVELQQEALNTNVQTTTLLRKALVVAKKLDISEFEKWLNFELNGYDDETDIPEYRMITGEVKVFHRFHGYYPAICPDPELQQKLTHRPVFTSVGEIEALLKNEHEAGSYIEMSLPGTLGIKIAQGVRGDQPAKLHVSTAQFHKILDNVRTIVLNWCLKLEKDGILGDGHSLTFSKEERQTAAMTTYNVNNFYGGASQLQIQQGTNASSQKGSFTLETSEAMNNFVKELRAALPKLQLDSDDREEAQAEVSTLEAQLSSSRPKSKVIEQSLKTLRNVLEGATGSILASELLQKIPLLLKMIGAA
jgi:hypothetical protein